MWTIEQCGKRQVELYGQGILAGNTFMTTIERVSCNQQHMETEELFHYSFNQCVCATCSLLCFSFRELEWNMKKNVCSNKRSINSVILVITL